MCGIVGFVEPQGSDRGLKLEAMCRRIQSRGPDDFGRWVCPDTGLALGHRRLAILDLSPRGHQPMHSRSERYVVVFNGEIYNFKRLQSELEAGGAVFSGGSDTEILLEAVEQWGVVDAVKKFVGMFALALWDKKERQLHLIRDRVGKKPLYYGWNREIFYFGSEIKALYGHPRFRGEINTKALSLMLRYGYVPSPHSIYRGIYKLRPGTILTLSADNFLAKSGPYSAEHPTAVPYWNAEEIDLQLHQHRNFTNEEDALNQFEKLLEDAVSIRMLSDVPLGAFLSGGIDSSLVVAMMQRISQTPVRTFSIGFHEKSFNEAHYAERIARHLGTVHTEQYLSSQEALSVIPRMATIFDEPFGDQSQIPTFLVSELAKKSVTVALSGDGGDEIFAGYFRYWNTEFLWQMLRFIPRQLRGLVGHGVRVVPEKVWGGFFSTINKMVPGYLSEKDIAAKVERVSHVLQVHNYEQLYQRLISFHEHDLQIVQNQPPVSLEETIKFSHKHDALQRIERLMLIDLLTYLPDDIMVKVDRCTMAVSLEARAPLLDHRIIEYSWRIPVHLKRYRGESKYLLKKLLERMVPRQLFERPKMGFGIPYNQWMRTELRSWCSDLLSPASLEEHGLLMSNQIAVMWRDFLNGRDAYAGLLWNVILFQSWYSKRKGTP